MRLLPTLSKRIFPNPFFKPIFLNPFFKVNLIFFQLPNPQGIDPRVIHFQEGEKYSENFSTLYDLSYNHFPKCMYGPNKTEWRFRMGRHEPEPDMALNYGNITNFGLKEYKKEIWRCDKAKGTPNTVSMDAYQPPAEEDYKFHRYSHPKFVNFDLKEEFRFDLICEFLFELIQGILIFEIIW